MLKNNTITQYETAGIPMRKRYIFFNQFANFFNINILDAATCEVDKRWNSRIPNTDVNRLFLIYDGNGSIIINKQTFDLKKDHLYFIPVNSSLILAGSNYLKLLYFHFEFSVSTNVNITDIVKPVRFEKKVQSNVVKKFEAVLKGSNIVKLIELKQQLLSYLFNFFDPEDINTIGSHFGALQHYKDIFKYIDDHLSIKIRNTELAELANLPIKYFSSIFKKDIGINIKSYIANAVLKKSKLFLLNSNQKITSIAHALGFYDEYHFSHFFKKHLGLSPSQYRSKNRFAI